jgi:Reverse transcriptase (RNA-dependent DNA polymerase)
MKNGETRVCINYRQLNSLTVPDIYPLPLIEKLINEYPHACIFSKIDLKSAYNQIRICKGDKKYTSFQTPKGNYEYLVMPFGMCNSPSAFQRIMDMALQPVLGPEVCVYLDDILIRTTMRERHIVILREVVKRLLLHDLRGQITKCVFLQDQVEFLGHELSKDTISITEENINKITHWETPQTTKKLQKTLGFFNYIGKFIYNYSYKIHPLIQLLNQNIK